MVITFVQAKASFVEIKTLVNVYSISGLCILYLLLYSGQVFISDSVHDGTV